MPFLIAVLFVLIGDSMAAPNVSGRWILKMEPDFRGNPGIPVECIFKQREAALTVKCGTGGEMKGEVRERELIWGFEKTGILPMLEDRVVVTYRAEVKDSASIKVIKGTVKRPASVAANDDETLHAQLRTSISLL